jgi:hypothetical protein
MYIVDDGTGLIDILHFSDSDWYSLPSLSGHTEEESYIRLNVFEPGDMVRIFGHIQCKAVKISAEMNTATVQGKYNNNVKQFIPASSIIREIHASVIVPLVTIATSRSRALPYSIDYECEHWMNCVKFLQKRSSMDGSRTTGDDIASESSSSSSSSMLHNASDVLPLLGNDLVHQMMERNAVYTSSSSLAFHDLFDDRTQAWRLFGTQCQCTNMAFKRNLLYCHCMATRHDPMMDPNLKYREALLMKLLADEAMYRSNLPPPKSVQDIWNDIVAEVEDDQICHHFHFQYSSIATDDRLNQIAMEVILKNDASKNLSTSTVSGSDVADSRWNQTLFRKVQELVRGTVRDLRNDGILYLVNAESDTYLFVTRTGVLEPYIRNKLALQKLSTERRNQYYEASVSSIRFPYIKSVPRSRLEFVRRCVMAADTCK